MRRIAVLTGSVSLFLLLVMLAAPFVAPVAVGLVVRKVPTEYLTIQAAVDAANPGDIIQVASGIYHEHVVVNKSLTIVGENRSATIIDGDGKGIVVRINAPDVTLRGFTVQNGGGFPNSGILMGSCVRNTIRENIIRYNAFGMDLHGSNGSDIVANTIMDNSWAGIRVSNSSDNVIHYNLIVNNSMGVWVTSNSSLFNRFYHNNFVGKPLQGHCFSHTTLWDDGDGKGNYWSDYVGADDGSNNRTAGDGVGDTFLPHLGLDYYPLMEPWRLPGDINGDGRVNSADFILLGKALYTKPGDPKWNPDADLNQDGKIGTQDIIILGKYFGKVD